MIHVFISAVCAVRSRFSSNSHRANRRKASELDSGDRADDKPVLKEYVTTVTSRRKTLRRFYHIFLALPMQFQPIHVLVVSHKKGLKKPCSMQVGVAAGTLLPESEQDYFQTPVWDWPSAEGSRDNITWNTRFPSTTPYDSPASQLCEEERFIHWAPWLRLGKRRSTPRDADCGEMAFNWAWKMHLHAFTCIYVKLLQWFHDCKRSKG